MKDCAAIPATTIGRAIPFVRHTPGEAPVDRVLEALANAGEATLFELRTAAGLHAIQADNAVAQLVRQRRVRRVHSPDGVLRYQLLRAAARAPRVAPVFVDGTVNRIDADVLGVLAFEGRAMMFGAVAERLSARYDESTVKRALARLKERGLARCEGRLNQTRWIAEKASGSLVASISGAATTSGG